MKKFIDDVIEKGQMVLSLLFNKIDYNLSRTIQLLREKQEKLKQFIIKQETLINEISRKEQEVKKLKEQISQIQNEQKSKQLDILRNELNRKLDDLLNSQRKYFELEQRVEVEQKRVNSLLQDKQQLEQERKVLKTKYDQLKSKLHENKQKTQALEIELDETKSKELELKKLLQGSINKDEINHFEKQILEAQLQFQQKSEEYDLIIKENNKYKSEYQNLEKDLLHKISSLTKLSNELNQVNNTLNDTLKEKELIRIELDSLEESLNQANAEIYAKEREIDKLRKVERELQCLFDIATEESSNVKQRMLELQEEALKEMISSNERIDELEYELVDQKNQLTLEKAKLGEPEVISDFHSKLLKKEFEPRFRNLYNKCEFYPEFLSDFTQLTTEERIKVEVAISELNFNYKNASSKCRPDKFKGSKTPISEFPFGTDSTGRIYFHVQEDLIHLHRLSRTKNGKGKLTQDNVLAWLKVNK